MKTTKLFFMAALALMTAACSNDDNDLTTQQPQKAEGITITAQLAPKTNAATTRAVAPGKDGSNKDIIVSTWAVNEHIAVLYEVSSTKYVADARITAVDGTTGTATISFNVEGGTPDNTACTLVYPLSAAKDDHTGVKDAATLLAAQDGTLSANLDVRVGAGTIQTTTPGLTVTTQPAAQFAIWKLTLDKTAKDLYITANGELIAGATLASAGTEFTVAVPSVSSKTVAVVATNGSSDCWSYSKAGVSLAAGNYYQSSPKMTALDGDNTKDAYKITGTVGGQTIGDGKTVVLSGVTISSNQIACSGDATIILMGANTVTAAANTAAIKIGGSGTTLTITGSGSLTATGGSRCAGIGTDSNGSGGNIVINGGTVTATGGNAGAGIGTGQAQNATNTCGDITINGGTVTANGGNNGGAGIGTGLSVTSVSGTASNSCGAITIGTGVTSVTAKKSSNNSGPDSIGKGRIAGSGTQTCGTITFGSAQVFNGTDWSPSPMVAGTYGGLTLAITTTTNTDDTWTLTPAP